MRFIPSFLRNRLRRHCCPAPCCPFPSLTSFRQANIRGTTHSSPSICDRSAVCVAKCFRRGAKWRGNTALPASCASEVHPFIATPRVTLAARPKPIMIRSPRFPVPRSAGARKCYTIRHPGFRPLPPRREIRHQHERKQWPTCATSTSTGCWFLSP